MHWLLIAIWNYGPPTMMWERFPNQSSCENVRKWLENRDYVNKPSESICIEDFDAPPKKG